jgi:hypothetical protein
MTLHFHIRREDVLAFSRQYHEFSPTYRKTRLRARLMLPVMMLALWVFTTNSAGFEWTSTIIFFGGGLLWYFLYPLRFDKNVARYSERLLDEGGHGKCLGPCELTLADDGLHSKSSTGQGMHHWSAVDRVVMTDAYLFIFLTGSIGFPIKISDVGADVAKSAHDFSVLHATHLNHNSKS